MSIPILPNAISYSPSIRYPSLAALQAAHNGLLQLQRQDADAPAFLAEVAAFLREGAATGALLDADADRRTAQGLLDYWVARLYRVGEDPPDATLAEFDPALAPELPDDLCPYLGLDAFREVDGDKFFGRDELIARLVERLADQRLLAIVGPSGSGKSSLVRAGLIPALKRGALPGSQDWRYLPTIVPGSDPMASLARVMRTENQEPRTEIDASVLGSPVVLVVDQFEELFTLCDDDQARQAFVAALRDFMDTPEAEHRLILTMRSDFETFVARAPDLQARFNLGRIQVTPLSAAELRESIEQPAEAVGLKFQAGIVDSLLQDILGEPAGLPLLQFTLLKLWEQRDHNRVTREIYEHVGGGRLALARSADEFYAGLIPEEQVTARRILLRMIRPGEGLEITSSRIRSKELYRGGEDPGRVDRVLARLISAHLVRLTAGETPEDGQIEVAHEALVRNWPTLVDWLEQEKAALATRRRLEGRAAEWVRLGQDSGGLLDEVELREAERWLGSAEARYLGYEPALPALADASRAALDQDEREKEAARQRELELAQALVAAQARTAQRLLRAAVALMVLLVLALTAMVYAFMQQRNAQEQRVIAESQQLAFAAQSQARDAPETALLLAYESVARNSNSVSEQTLRSSLEQALGSTILISHTAPVVSMMFSPDGKRILTASDDGAARLWDTNDGLLVTLVEQIDGLESIVFSPDGRHMLTVSADHTARIWDTHDQLAAVQTSQLESINSAAFSPDGQRILTISSDKEARLWNTSGIPLATLVGHNGEFVSAVFSPDGQRILTALADGTSGLWDANGKQLTTLKGQAGPIVNAPFSSDGQRILTTSFDEIVLDNSNPEEPRPSTDTNGTAWLWDANGHLLKSIQSTTGRLMSVTLSKNGERILARLNNSTAQLWDSKGVLIATLQGHPGAIRDAVLSADDQRILTTSTGGTVRLWDANGSPLVTLQGQTEKDINAVFSLDGQRFLTGSADGTIRLWDVNGSLVSTLQGHITPILHVVFSSDGQRILTASADGTIRLWNTNSNVLPPLLDHPIVVYSAVFSPDGQRILTAGADLSARVWSTNGTLLATLRGHSDVVLSAVFSPDGQHILTASFDRTVRLWDADGIPLGLPLKHDGPVRSAIFSADGQRILTGSDDHTAQLWDKNGRYLATLKGHTGAVNRAIFSPDGQRILTASDDRTARLWDASGRVLATLMGHTASITGVAFSPDKQLILTASADHTARLWDKNGRMIAMLEGHTGSVRGAMFSPDGRLILTASDDHTAKLWNTTGELMATLRGHAGAVVSAIFSPDGQRILTVSDDRSIRLWDVNGTERAVFQNHTDKVWSAVFSPNSQRFVTASSDGTGRQYLVYTQDLLAVAACRVGRGLTDDEIILFQVPTPLKFDFAKRQCPPTLGN
jgi:WD40 repeat protein